MRTIRSIALVAAAALIASCGGAAAPGSEGRNVARVVTREGMPQRGTSTEWITSLAFSPDLDKFVGTGGDFVHGLQTGFASMFSTVKPEADSLAATFPRTNGRIYSVAPAAVGGFYVAGEFTSIGGVQRSYLAKVNIDGTVDEQFDARIVPKDAVAGWNPAVLDVALVDSGRVLAVNAREMRSYGGTAQAESLVFLDPATGAHRAINGQGRYLGPFPRLHGAWRLNANATMSWAGNDLFEKPVGWGQGVPPARRTTWQFGNSISRVNDESWTQTVATKLPSFVGATRAQSQFTTGIEVAGDDVIILGNLDKQGRRLAAFSRTTGEMRDWNPALQIPASSIENADIAVTPTTVFIVAMNGDSLRGYRIDRSTAQVREWVLDESTIAYSAACGTPALFEFGDGVIVSTVCMPVNTVLYAEDGSRSANQLPLVGYIGDVVNIPSCKCAILLSRQPTNSVKPGSVSSTVLLDAIGNADLPPTPRIDGREIVELGSAGQWIYALSTDLAISPAATRWMQPAAEIVAAQTVIRFDAVTGTIDPTWSMTPVDLPIDESQFLVGTTRVAYWANDPDIDLDVPFVGDTVTGGPARRIPGFTSGGQVCDFNDADNTVPIAADRLWAGVECNPVAGNAAAPTFPVASLDLVTGQWTLHQQPTAVWNFAGDQRTTILASETHLYFHDARSGRPLGEFRITAGLEWTARTPMLVTLDDKIVLFDYSSGQSRAFSTADFSDLGPWRDSLKSWLLAVVRGSDTILATVPRGSVIDLGDNVEATGFVAFDVDGKALTTKPLPPTGGDGTAVNIQPVPAGSLPVGTPVEGTPGASDGLTTGPLPGPRSGSADRPSVVSVRAGSKAATVTFASPATGAEHVVEVAGTKLSCRTTTVSCTVKGLKSHVWYAFTVRTVDGSTPPSDPSAPVRPFVSMKRNARAKATGILAPAGKGAATWRVTGACSFNKTTSQIVTSSKRGRCAVSVTTKAAGKSAVTRKAVVVVS